MTNTDLTEALLGREIPLNFVSVREAVRLHDESIDRVGGTPGARDMALLESALHRPMMMALYEDEMDLSRLAAGLGFSLAQNHPFLDGNKRAAFLCTKAFLAKNNAAIDTDVAEAVDMFVGLASHRYSEQDLEVWLRSYLDAAEDRGSPRP